MLATELNTIHAEQYIESRNSLAVELLTKHFKNDFRSFNRLCEIILSLQKTSNDLMPLVQLMAVSESIGIDSHFILTKIVDYIRDTKITSAPNMKPVTISNEYAPIFQACQNFIQCRFAHKESYKFGIVNRLQ